MVVVDLNRMKYIARTLSTQTGRPRITFEENTGLPKVWSVEFTKEIIESKVFKKQLERLSKIINK